MYLHIKVAPVLISLDLNTILSALSLLLWHQSAYMKHQATWKHELWRNNLLVMCSLTTSSGQIGHSELWEFIKCGTRRRQRLKRRVKHCVNMVELWVQATSLLFESSSASLSCFWCWELQSWFVPVAANLVPPCFSLLTSGRSHCVSRPVLDSVAAGEVGFIPGSV